MAKIDFFRAELDSLSVKLTKLDTTWTDGNRTVTWYLGYANSETEPTESDYYKKAETIIYNSSPPASESPPVTITGLPAAKKFKILCVVKKSSNNEELTRIRYINGKIKQKYVYTLSWDLVAGNIFSIGNINQSISRQLNVQSYNFYVYILNFDYSGEVKFYAEDGTGSNIQDTVGYLTTQATAINLEGVPIGPIIACDETGSGHFQFTANVQSNQTYYLWVRTKEPSDNGSLKVYIKLTAAPSGVSFWDWESSNGSASATETNDALNAVKDRSSLKNFKFKVWNDLVDKVNEILVAKGESWDNTYASYDSTKLNYIMRYLTAEKFNSLILNIDNNTSGNKIPGVAFVTRGATVFGYYFIRIANYINYWIERDLL